MFSMVCARSVLLAAAVLGCLEYASGQDGAVGSLYQQCNQTIYEGQGVIASPNFPQAYPDNTHCTWTIVVEFGRTVTLSFGYFDIERSLNCMYDAVSVYNGPTANHPLLGKFCGAFRPGHIVSTSNQMLVSMKTDNSGTNAGFYALFSSAEPTIATLDSCGGLLVDLEGSFHSPNYPKAEYPPSVTCAWHIRTSQDRHVNLYFDDFQVESSAGCKYDSVTIYGGWSNLDDTRFLGRYCGEMDGLPPVITSPGNDMFITFVSDGSGIASGFNAKFATKKVAQDDLVSPQRVCGETTVLSTLRGDFASPGYGTRVAYANDLSCSWRIVAPEGGRIQLRITDFNLEKDDECERDYLAVYFGSDSTGIPIGQFCGSMPERSLMSTRNEMFVVFHTDSVGGDSGFRARYNVFLPEIITETSEPEVIPVSLIETAPKTTTEFTTTTASTTTTTTAAAPPTTRRPVIFYQCPTTCPPRIKFKAKICSADYIALVRISDIKTLKAQSIVGVDIAKVFKQGSLPSTSRTNLRIACRRCSNLSKKTTYLIAGNTITHEGIEVRPEDLVVRFKQRKHTKVVTKLMARCRVRRQPRKGRKSKSNKGKKKRNTSKKISRSTT